MSAPVYHYTDTARLPWILLSGQLQPGRNVFGGFPDPDFLWATTSPVGDRTASASVAETRAGRARLVRFVLPEWAFEPWQTIVERFPAWTPTQVARLEHLASGKSDPRTWLCRAEVLPRDRWLAVETRGWVDKAWRPIDPTEPPLRLSSDIRGCRIGPKVYVSQQIIYPSGAVGYQVEAVSPADITSIEAGAA